MNLNSGIVQSCDLYFYEIARRTGIDRIASMARRLGFGSRLGLDLPGEKGGIIPTDKWKRAVIGAPWQQGETLLAGIGQGYVLTTPLQLAVMLARIVNGGVAVVPHVTRGLETKKDPAAGQQEKPQDTGKDIGLSPVHLALVRKAMEDVVNTPRGTAFRSRIKKPEFRMGGKTGTAQVRRISRKERETRVLKNHERPWKERDHALFVGYAPLDAPRYCISVIVEHGGGGAKMAAPIAHDVLLEAQRRGSARPAKDLPPDKALEANVNGDDKNGQG